LFERPKSGERAVLVHVDFRQAIEAAPNFQEFKELAQAAGAEAVCSIQIARDKPDPKFFVGKGKVDELNETVRNLKVELVLINHDLSPSQERNLEKALKCRVLSRTGLILDIFASRARTFEGKLQVELAQLQHVSTRLVRGWTHLERQKGGIGLRGPGETQLETDRRLVRHRIQVIKQRLSQVQLQRQQNRRARVKQAIPTVAIVGYTNAGKSTLFNKLTGADVLIANQLFATLDPTARTITLPSIGPLVLIDTVGFVQNLPHTLVDAFRATLEETALADLLVHVVDASSEHKEQNILAVNQVLTEIGANEVPQILVLNKADLLENGQALMGIVESPIEEENVSQLPKIFVSAVQNLGLNELRQLISEYLHQDMVITEIDLAPNEGAFRAALYALKSVEKETHLEEGGWQLSVKLTKAQWQKLNREKRG
jgi:GTP-binding protein HflX